jgi:hypothetical protein
MKIKPNTLGYLSFTSKPVPGNSEYVVRFIEELENGFHTLVCSQKIPHKDACGSCFYMTYDKTVHDHIMWLIRPTILILGNKVAKAGV